MAQLTYGGQGQHAVLGPVAATLMLLMILVFSLVGIKIWGFRRRLNFDRSAQTATRASQQSLTQTPPRYAAYESQVNGTDNAVHGVFRQRNTDEFESSKPTNSAGNKYLTGSVPNLQLATFPPREYKDEASIPELAGTVPYRRDPQAARRRRREVHSASYDYYAAPPTRQPPAPPAPPAPKAAVEPNTQLDIPNFDHFAEKYKLISAQPNSQEMKDKQLTNKQSGRYVKYEQVDDVPELLTPDDDQARPISVTAVVHHVPTINQQETEPNPEPERQPKTSRISQIASDAFLQLEHTDSAFVVEIIAGTPDSIEQTETVIAAPNMFDNLETVRHVEDAEFERIRSTYEMNEADILDMQPDFAGLQLPVPSSPPGFGKSIDEDWENFEHLDNVTELPEPNWLVHPAVLESPQRLELDNVVQQESLFQQLELMEPAVEEAPQLPPPADYVEPPPYEMELPILPDYESLMEQESTQPKHNLPKYADVVGGDKENGAKYVSSIEDLFVELQVNGEATTPPAEQVHNFEELCEELDIAPSPLPASRQPPQPAPRISKPTTLNVRGDALPLTCYEPGELPSSSSSETEAEAPQPAKRKARTLKVRFDVDNLQYYQSAEVPSSNESEMEFGSADEHDAPLSPPRPMQRLITLSPVEQVPKAEHDVPRLFGTQVSQEDSDDEAFGRAIRQHRSMTEALRPAIQLDRTAHSDRDRDTEA